MALDHMERKPLRVGLLLNSVQVPNWAYVMIERIEQSHYANIELLIIHDTVASPKKRLAKRLKDNWNYLFFIAYEKIDKKLFKRKHDAFEEKNIQDICKDVPVINVKTKSTKYVDRFSRDDVETLKGYDFDVMIRLGFRIIKGQILNVARYGVWSYHHGDNQVNRGGPAGFWEVMQGWRETGVTLQVLNEDLDNGVVLYRSFSQTDPISVQRNKNISYWKALSFIPRKLEELYRFGEQSFFERVERENLHPGMYSEKLYSPSQLTNRVMFQFLVNLIIRYLRQRYFYSFYQNQWLLLYRIQKQMSTSFWRYKKITPPKDRFWADPHIVSQDDHYYIFIEELMFHNNKGHISVITMDQRGNYRQPEMVLEEPFHLSYPFVFTFRGDYYMMPESASNRSISIYQCVEFPGKWEFKLHLMEDIEARDATLFFYNHKWWLFANVRENEGASHYDELFLYYADDLFDQPWHPHPLNPIVSDVKRARPAGKIFEHKGRLYRPSQDCSYYYGYGIVIHEIQVLTEHAYREVEVGSIEPGWDEMIKGVHTLNHEGQLTCVDGLRYQPKYW